MRHLLRRLAVLVCLPALSLQISTLGQRDLTKLSADDIATLVSITDPVKNIDPLNPVSHLSRILIPRVADTQNNTLVRNYIIDTMKALKWEITEDEFTADTPLGRKKFTNVIATKDPQASRRVILSAHFDSKYFEHFEFLGATDSAAPCAMMLDLAETLDPLFNARAHRLEEDSEEDEDVADTTLQLVFFDGEEAFKDWTDTDSIYGARNLADRWANEFVVPGSKRRAMGAYLTEIQTIEHLILLDLLGAPNPQIRSYFLDTAWLFDAIISSEARLGEMAAFVYGDDRGMSPGRWRSFFRPRQDTLYNFGHVGDDHVPFLKKDVSVLHLITEPFPSVWHTIRDDASALDIPTMRRWNLLLRVFFSEYFNLRPSDFHHGARKQRLTTELNL